jgi:3-hydroxybutyryl-CoA dehydrogenase
LQETVAIIGAGPLGRRLALAAARGGFRVLLEDVMPQNLHHAQEFLRQQLGPDALSSEPDAAVGFVSTIEDAVREADLAIDCVPDELESKLEIFCLLDRMAPPRTVLATPTTRLSITLEMRTTSKTSGATVELLTRFWTRTGFIPVFSADPAEFKAEPA